jgi:hypothetical protein
LVSMEVSAVAPVELSSDDAEVEASVGSAHPTDSVTKSEANNEKLRLRPYQAKFMGQPSAVGAHAQQLFRPAGSTSKNGHYPGTRGLH